MGTVRTVDELVRKFDKLGGAIRQDSPDIVAKIAQFMKVRALGLAAQEVGGDLRFSGNKRRPLGVRYDIDKKSDGARAEVRARGPFSWLEYGVQPHPVIPGSRNKRFRGLAGIGVGVGPALPVTSLLGTSAIRGNKKGKLLRFANGDVRPYALKAGGYPAKQTWTEAREATEAAAGEIADRELVRTLTDVLR
jgi:hypothetical protein